MNGSKIGMPEFRMLLGGVIAFPVLIIGARLVIGDALPLQAMTVMGAAGATYLVWAGMGLAAASERGRVASLSEAAAAEEAIALPAGFAGLELLYAMPAPPAPKTVAVTSSVGVCPRGLLTGDSIEIDKEGHLSLPLCRTAVEALIPALQTGFDGGLSESLVGCICPVAGRHLMFSVGPGASVGVT